MAKAELSADELRFTDVDHYNHEALCALDPAEGRGVGIARYIRDAEDPQSTGDWEPVSALVAAALAPGQLRGPPAGRARASGTT